MASSWSGTAYFLWAERPAHLLVNASHADDIRAIVGHDFRADPLRPFAKRREIDVEAIARAQAPRAKNGPGVLLGLVVELHDANLRSWIRDVVEGGHAAIVDPNGATRTTRSMRSAAVVSVTIW